MAFDRNEANITDDDGLLIEGGTHITSASGAPAHAGVEGDIYFRADTGRLYRYTTTPSAQWVLLDAEDLPFDPTGSPLTEIFAGPAIRELANSASVSGSPGYAFGRNGNVSNNTWLRRSGNVPSNRAGITVALQNASISQIFVSARDLDVFNVVVYEHDGNLINLDFVGQVTVNNDRSPIFNVNFGVSTGRQLAVRVQGGSTRDIGVGLQLQGEAT